MFTAFYEAENDELKRVFGVSAMCKYTHNPLKNICIQMNPTLELLFI